jgi:hypothetical protein
MKKFILSFILVISLFTSCKKDSITKPATNTSHNFSTVVVNLSSYEIVGINLSGFTLVNLCTGDDWNSISGEMALYLAPSGKLESFGIDNFVFRDIMGKVYHGIYDAKIQSMTTDGFMNTYKITCSPQNNSSNFTFYALIKIAPTKSGLYQITVDSGALDCH